MKATGLSELRARRIPLKFQSPAEADPRCHTSGREAWKGKSDTTVPRRTTEALRAKSSCHADAEAEQNPNGSTLSAGTVSRGVRGPSEKTSSLAMHRAHVPSCSRSTKIYTCIARVSWSSTFPQSPSKTLRKLARRTGRTKTYYVREGHPREGWQVSQTQQPFASNRVHTASNVK